MEKPALSMEWWGVVWEEGSGSAEAQAPANPSAHLIRVGSALTYHFLLFGSQNELLTSDLAFSISNSRKQVTYSWQSIILIDFSFHTSFTMFCVRFGLLLFCFPQIKNVSSTTLSHPRSDNLVEDFGVLQRSSVLPSAFSLCFIYFHYPLFYSLSFIHFYLFTTCPLVFNSNLTLILAFLLSFIYLAVYII